MFEILDIGASGLQAQRTRLDTIAENIANVNTTRGPNGEKTPFRRRLVQFAQGGQAADDSKAGVHVASIDQDQSPFIKKWDPHNPDADEQGYVSLPNVDTTVEFVNALDASRAYEANATMMETAKSMFSSTLRLLA
jgi:flagellar basal-body rod protein FlgC